MRLAFLALALLAAPEATAQARDSVTVSAAFYEAAGICGQEVVQLRARIETADTVLRTAITREREAAKIACDFRTAVLNDRIGALQSDLRRQRLRLWVERGAWASGVGILLYIATR